MSQPAAGGAAAAPAGSAPIGPIGATPTRRGTELFLLAFAAVLVTAALVLVEANQEQSLTMQVVYYGVAYTSRCSVRRTTRSAAGRPMPTR